MSLSKTLLVVSYRLNTAAPNVAITRGECSLPPFEAGEFSTMPRSYPRHCIDSELSLRLRRLSARHVRDTCNTNLASTSSFFFASTARHRQWRSVAECSCAMIFVAMLLPKGVSMPRWRIRNRVVGCGDERGC